MLLIDRPWDFRLKGNQFNFDNNARDLLREHANIQALEEMTSTDTVVKLDQFRHIRQALANAVPQCPLRRNEPTATDWYLPGFVGKARVGTTFGELPIEALRVRDDLRTYSGSIATVQSIDKIHLDGDFIRSNPRALPIRIPANSFGPGRPAQDLFISPGQEICTNVHVAAAFVTAEDLRGRFTMDLSQATGLTYYRFHCGAPAIVSVEGIWVRMLP